jgi:hypothetical protein
MDVRTNNTMISDTRYRLHSSVPCTVDTQRLLSSAHIRETVTSLDIQILNRMYAPKSQLTPTTSVASLSTVLLDIGRAQRTKAIAELLCIPDAVKRCDDFLIIAEDMKHELLQR